MTDRPILFSGPMVRAIIEGRKSQTRRVVRGLDASDQLRESPFVTSGIETTHGRAVRVPYAVGDRLWVRETWSARMEHGWTIADARSHLYPADILYQASGHESIDGWWPSIHMPREFSRITLVVTDVRVQCVQEISEADALAEGIALIRKEIAGRRVREDRTLEVLPNRFADVYALDADDDHWCEESAVDRYRFLWNRLNSERGYAWETNPWVVALTFDVHRSLQHRPPQAGDGA